MVAVFNLGRREQAVLFIFMAVLLFTAGYRLAARDKGPAEPTVLSENNQREQQETGPVVYVVGAVEKPGVYKLPPGSRVNDALKLAVPLPEADLTLLNLAMVLKDEQRLAVAFQAEASEPETVPQAAPEGLSQPAGQAVMLKKTTAVSANSGLININTADETELDRLPGIGPALASRIIQYREINGSFQSIEDIKNVSGIGDKKYADLQSLITVQ
ncbi:competence protein ComEA helix-hairpin-helix repeat protein [Desulforamulus ruminis DSM 2154]|uniref:Competence protein ComEA helix-hairpin-helix repeat protein n=1 Tax=Desulforamulus ruminis (strain ATCC 23193 / DSM 2154 / NCIMB 8452 / DL) TaxID=696281 RepID=F6DLZ4_DESRL|nr:competence protein ComEA helix-hairpin-helix repeat protein [Desulforamulus ruminis DSM 2154]